jgi:hypothetical protein
MKKTIINLALWSLIGCLLATNVYAAKKEKLAQTGFQFLSVVSDARAAAMGEAMTSLYMGSNALFFNPAGMAEMKGLFDISASQNKWIADITHSTVSFGLNPLHGRYGVIGFSLQTVDYGDFYGTRIDKSSDRGYVDTDVFNLTALAAGMGYAKQLTDRFAVGGQIRWVRQNLGESVIPKFTTTVDKDGKTVPDTTEQMVENELTPLAFDFGTRFHVGLKSLVFGMSVRNFSQEIKYVEEGFQLPLVFNLGISMNLMDLIEGEAYNQSLLMSVDASHDRSHAEQIKIGLDYQIMNVLSLRGGYISSNDESGFSFGLGVAYMGVGLDYAYTPFGLFDNVQRMTARFTL